MRFRAMGFALLAFFLTSGLARAGSAQPDEPKTEIGLQFAANHLSDFDQTDKGISGRISYRLNRFLAVEGEVGFYPEDLAIISSSRVDGLFGVKVGSRRKSVGFFGTFRPGFVRFSEPSQSFACILIYPPPLACAVPGANFFAIDFGGGAEVLTSRRTLLRVDVGDKVLRYPPAFGGDRKAHPDGFWSHNLRISVGGGLRF